MTDNKKGVKHPKGYQNSIKNAIHSYTQDGLYIFPIKPKSKEPSTPHGFKDATNNFDAFMKYYRAEVGIGLETGSKNNIYVIDCDVEKEDHKPILKNGKPVQLGFLNFRKHFNIKNASDRRLNTRMVKTQSGGLHIYYKLPDGKEPLKSVIGKLPGLDLKGEGGYVVAPPSVGQYGAYEVVNDIPFEDLPEMPLEFYDFFAGKGTGEKRIEIEEDQVPPGSKPGVKDTELLVDTIAQIFSVKTGLGNHLTIYLAGALAKRGYTESETIEIFNKAAAKNGWNSNEWVGPVKATFKKFKDSPEETGGLSLLFQELEKGKDSYGVKYDELLNNLNELLVHKYTVILKQGLEWGIIRDSVPGREGTITYFQKKQKFDKKTHTPVTNEAGQFVFENIPEELVEYNGSISVCRLEDSKTGLSFCFDDDEQKNLAVSDAITYIIQYYGVQPKHRQRLISILRGFALQYGKNAPYIPLSPVSVKDGKINVDFDTSKIPIEDVLNALRNFTPNASNPQGYLATFSFSVLAWAHYYVKKLSQQTVYVPNLVLTGKTKGGKTALTDFFILKAYDVFDDKDNFQYHVGDISTKFTLMTSLKASNIPAVFDDINTDFFDYHKEDIKGYQSSIRFGQRGTAAQNTNKYYGIRSFAVTLNDDLDKSSDLALSGRLIIIPFDEGNTRRKNRDRFIKFYNSVPNGFMFAILKHLFHGKPINELVAELENLDTPDKWVSKGLSFINKLCQQLEIPTFPEYETVKTKSETMVYQIAASLASEYERGLNNQYHNSPLWGEVYTENKGKGKSARKFIYFTGGAFRKIVKNYNNHFSTATNYLNNIPEDDEVKVENGGKTITKRIESGSVGKHLYVVSIPDLNEDLNETDTYNDNSPGVPGNGNNSSVVNTTYENIPDGPVKDELVQDKEDIENEKLKRQEDKLKQQPAETVPENANQEITKDFIEEIREKLETENFMLDGNHGLSFDKKDFQLYVHPTDLPLDRFTRLKDIMKSFGFQYSLIQAPYGIRFIRKIRGGVNE